ncbi:BamA/TamA family outer membrane protein [Marseilla massiliensis]|uniref:BamA/TamA family outer membrane protein n=1 Tax=Marseilla massiliensis TaxID=1841864 RepID=A0A938WS42_9BACT|nr:BamA/TamA family outer membrane protein [Marseilla massiliensis]
MVSTLIIVVTITACSASKFIPEGSYLLDDVKIKSDTKNIETSQLEPYIRQKGNSKWFSLFKVPLGTYALSGRDTTKWINRKLQALGEGPVLFDSLQAEQTCNDLSNVLHGMGYIKAQVDYALKREKKKKVKVIYNLHPGKRYHISSINYDIQDKNIDSVLKNKKFHSTNLRIGMPFMVSVLDNEREQITDFLNNNGYVNFHKDFISYSADTISGSTDIDITLHLHKFISGNGEEETEHKQYTIGKINYHANGDFDKIPLRKSVLEENTIIEAGKLYNADELQKTYNRFGRLPIVKYTNIKFTERPDSNILDCNIGISTNKINSISFQPEGTNTAGDLGAAASLTYENRNIFRGAETFSIKLRGAFEAITGLEGYQNQDYEEYSLEAKLLFPRFVVPFLSKKFKKQSTAMSELTVSYNMQNRPEFHRRVFTASWRYRWNDISGKKSYKFDLIDLNYIYMPWISTTFKEEYLDDVNNRNSILRYNYEDLFIMKLGFGMSFNNGDEAYKINVETSGNFLSGISHLLGSKRNENNQYTLFNIAFAQYVKGDFDYTKIIMFDRNNSLALHAGLGIAYPYGNSMILPFEKRYFSGGANSVRGWSVRGLGPGKFKGTNGAIDFINQTGDIKLDLNIELRSFLFWKVYGAAFIDAGNIWTIRAYEEQPGGQFRFKDFYKQIAVAYGLGIRFNFDFFILRFDMGMKAINPAYNSNNEHYAIFHPDFSRDFAFHFAVGLPF